ncbi:hypothetical protein [Spiroplasma endosymbiont of Dioctria linearis]|uniref:hypothetical protein n=1 Tax=Spiroplasma endosymbiont of Dioctria linearis TaxID=3066290 RepID=UPI00313AB746
MKALLIGNGFEIQFNKNMELNNMKTKIINSIENFEIITLFSDSFLEERNYNEIEKNFVKNNYNKIFEEIIYSILVSNINQYSIENYISDISFRIQEFFNEDTEEIISTFVKNLFLFYIEEQWKITEQRVRKFLNHNNKITNFLNSYDILLTTNYTKILSLINEHCSRKKIILNLHGKIGENDVNILWKNKKNSNQNLVINKLNSLSITDIDIIGLSFNQDNILFLNILNSLKFIENRESVINYYYYNDKDCNNVKKLIDIKTMDYLKNFNVNINKFKKQGFWYTITNKYENLKGDKYINLENLKKENNEIAFWSEKIDRDSYSLFLYLGYLKSNIIFIKGDIPEDEISIAIESEFYGYKVERIYFNEISDLIYKNQSSIRLNIIDYKDNFFGVYNNLFNNYFL